MKRLFIYLLIFPALFIQAQSIAPTWRTALDNNDSDRDGVADSKDPCPATPVGRAFVSQGCAALDLTQNPDILIGPAQFELAKLISRLGSSRENAALLDSLSAARKALTASGLQIRRGKVCESGPTRDSAMRYLSSAQNILQGMIDSTKLTLPAGPNDGGYGDAGPEDAALLDLEIRQAELQRVIQKTTQANAAFGAMCSAVVGAAARGVITRIDNANRRLELDNGMVLGFSLDYQSRQPLHPGDPIATGGIVYNDNTGIVATAQDFGGITLAPELYTECLKTMVVPVQPLPNGMPAVIHDPEGYRYGSNYMFEMGTRFTVDNTACPEHGNEKFSLIGHLAEAHLLYTSLSDGTPQDQTFGSGMVAGDVPANPWWGDVDLSQPVVLRTVSVGVQFAHVNGGAVVYTSSPVIKDFPLIVLPLHGACNAIYSSTKLSLPDDDPTAWTAVSVAKTQTLVTPDPGWPLTFKAYAYRIFANNTNSYPDAQEITDQMPFSMYSQFGPDFAIDAILMEDQLGINKASGLMWPHIQSYWNGHPFRYSCELPVVVRDLIQKCNLSRDDFHRLPFSGGYSDWTVSQGNNGSFTHKGKQAYAYDFAADQGTVVKAARGGSVLFVRENQNGNSYNDPKCGCIDNALAIEHQDGTQTVYRHFQYNQIFPQVGENVVRGQPVGLVGNTGYSTGPHVHIELRPDGSTQSVLMPFQLKLSEYGNPQACYVPVKNEHVWSNQ
jgi:murein DD-endopeptidase MepM/ murein hydrolase activator NlpD